LGAQNQVRHIKVCVSDWLAAAQLEAEGTNEDCNEMHEPNK
jgi:hypothetical protein